MNNKFVQKRDKIEKYRDMQHIMKTQITKMESIIQYQSNEIYRLENSVNELKEIINNQTKNNQDYIDANYLDQTPYNNGCESSDDKSTMSQDTNTSQTMKKNELGGTIKMIYIQHGVS
jgi:hypothetical protein